MTVRHMLVATIMSTIIQVTVSSRNHLQLPRTIDNPEKDAVIQQLLQFATTEHNKFNSHLQPSQVMKIIRVEKQIIGGIKHTLVVELRQNNSYNVYEFVVLYVPWKNLIQLLNDKCQVSDSLTSTQPPKKVYETTLKWFTKLP